MRYIINDEKYHFRSAFDTETGAYVRTGILDEQGRDTGVDPFMASFPHLIDVGVMGHYNGPPVKTTDQEKIVNKTDFGCIPSQDRARQSRPADVVAGGWKHAE